MYGLNNLDEKIYQILQELEVKNNFFIEAGANDGITQSNTALLEFKYGWSGVLVEPNLENFKKAASSRKNSKVYRGALVSKDYDKQTIQGIFSTDSLTRWGGLCSGVLPEHLSFAPEWICEVPAVTLSHVLEECKAPEKIGLLSLDVEGYEIQALMGLDTEKWRPNVIVLEIAKWDVIEDYDMHVNFMKSIDYQQHSKISGNDFVFYDARFFKS